MFTFFFAPAEVTDYASACRCDTARHSAFFRHMLDGGLLLPPSQFESCFLSSAHSDADVAHAAEAARVALERL